MNSKRIVLGIGIVLLALVVLTTHAAAENTVYFVPQHGNASTGNYTWMTMYIDLQEGDSLASGGMTIKFDREHLNITKVNKGCGAPGPNKYCWGALDVNYAYQPNGYNWAFVGDPQRAVWDVDDEYWKWESYPPQSGFEGPLTVRICKYKVEADGTPGVSPFNFDFEYLPPGCGACQGSNFWNGTSKEIGITWENGTFTHKGQSETFTTSLDLGWNLISLPLTPEDASTSAVLGNEIVYDHVYKYTSNQFVDVTSGTMGTRVGYFVNVTTAGTWSYDGTAYDAMSVSLSQGLNCVGWTNTSADIPGGALDSIAGDYRYVARWNAAGQTYELYDAMAPSGVPEFIDFTTMERGVGYFIAATAGCTLTYP